MLFLKHRHVLLELMAQGKEDIPWKTTAIAAYLENEPLVCVRPHINIEEKDRDAK